MLEEGYLPNMCKDVPTASLCITIGKARWLQQAKRGADQGRESHTPSLDQSIAEATQR